MSLVLKYIYKMTTTNLYNNIASPLADFAANITSLFTNFQLKDILDILVIALLVYAFLMLFIKTKSISIVVGIFSLLLVYALAAFLNLSLTQMIFKYFLGFLLVVIIIIFQRELRRFFEMLGILGMRRKIFVQHEDTIEAVLRAIQRFASAKIGALIVFPGLEPIEPHIEGGVYLGGRVSEQILSSIFDSSSPGHDGAVIIEGDKIKRFAAHLPLAEKIDAVRKFGTRHRAALGISEVTDSLCVVVSEERGTISLARNRKIEVVSDMEILEKKLRSFFEKMAPVKKVEPIKLLKKNIAPAAISLGVALVFWGIFAVQEVKVQRNFIAPVEFRNLPAGYVAEDLSSQEVILTLAGDERSFNLLDPKTLKISFDASEIKLGWHKLLVNKNSIKSPANLSIIKIDPPDISFRMNKVKLDLRESE